MEAEGSHVWPPKIKGVKSIIPFFIYFLHYKKPSIKLLLNHLYEI